jgi:hypothetical protein
MHMSNRQSIELVLTIGFSASMGSLRPTLIKLEQSYWQFRHQYFSTVLARLQNVQNCAVVGFAGYYRSGISSSSNLINFGRREPIEVANLNVRSSSID